MTTSRNCIAEKERRETELTGSIKLVHLEEGYDEDGNPCSVHDPRKKKKKMSDQQVTPGQARKERGEQLRALVASWAESKTFVTVLSEQQAKIDSGELSVNEDWSVMADEILGGFLSYNPNKMEWPKPQDTGPKIITP